jgi:small-conductance mechanosensitive channel
MDMLNRIFFENTLGCWLIALGTALGVLLILLLAKRFLIHRLVRLLKKSQNEVDDFLIPVLQQTKWFSLLAAGLYLGSFALSLPEVISDWFWKGLRLILALQVGFWGTGVIVHYISKGVASKIEQDHGEDATTLDALGLLSKIALWTVLALIILDNLGVKINSLVTSLGIGGIAVALAIQNILGDLFASLSIALDKPFVIGDFVVVGDFEGDVEDIGLKSTRIRSLSGEELIFANTDLLKSRIRNFKRLEKRRISFSFGIVYGTPADQLEHIPRIVEEIIAPLEHAEFERTHFRSLGDFALEFTVSYYVLLPEYAVYLDLQQKINLALYQRFEELGIEFAYPTQKVLVDRDS